jgi:hypothetical protein
MAKNLSKLYSVKLSDIKDTFEAKGATEPLNTRETELNLLTGLFELAANGQKTFVKSNECIEIIGRLENLTDEDTEVQITATDLEYLKEGLEKSAMGQRPMVWNKLTALIKQLADPQEVKEESKIMHTETKEEKE